MKRVLILCTGNSCRSQMAEAFWRSLGQGEWEAFSAGSKPAGYVHPLAIRVMAELDCEVDGLVSKSLDPFVGEAFDVVVTVCGNAYEACPVFPNAKMMLHWPFDDPADAAGDEEEKLAVFRRVRDEIRQKISTYLDNADSD